MSLPLRTAASLCGNGHARLPTCFTVCWSLHRFKDASVLHAAGKLTCRVSKAAVSALLLFWDGARFAPAGALKPPANCFFLAARSLCHRRVPEPWPPFLSSLSWNQTCLLEIDLHIQEAVKWLLKSFLVGTVTIFFFFFFRHCDSRAEDLLIHFESCLNRHCSKRMDGNAVSKYCLSKRCRGYQWPLLQWQFYGSSVHRIVFHPK